MAVITHLPVSDSDDGSCSENLSYSSPDDERDALEVSEVSTRIGMALRQREDMKRLHRGIMTLRSMVPTGRGSLAEDTAAYVQQLRNEIETVQTEIREGIARYRQVQFADLEAQENNETAQNRVKVQMNDLGLQIEVECEKRPGLASALSKVVDGLNLSVVKIKLACEFRINFYVLSEKLAGEATLDLDHIKTLLEHTISSYPNNSSAGT